MHGLSLAIIGLLLWDSALAAHYGFALSVAATAGIVALHPVIYRGLAQWRMPDILTRAIAVAIAADIVTIPIIAIMAGRVSLVSVLPNVLVSPAVAPITLFGLLAVILSLLPGGLEIIPLRILEPFSWWINHVASWCQTLPHAVLEIERDILTLLWIIVICAWLVVIFYKRISVILLFALVIFGGWSWAARHTAAEVDLRSVRYFVVETVEELSGHRNLFHRTHTGCHRD